MLVNAGEESKLGEERERRQSQNLSWAVLPVIPAMADGHS